MSFLLTLFKCDLWCKGTGYTNVKIHYSFVLSWFIVCWGLQCCVLSTCENYRTFILRVSFKHLCVFLLWEFVILYKILSAVISVARRLLRAAVLCVRSTCGSCRTSLYVWHHSISSNTSAQTSSWTGTRVIHVANNICLCFIPRSILTLKVPNFWQFTYKWSGWISDSYCSLKPQWSGMGEVVPARTSPTLRPPSPPTVL